MVAPGSGGEKVTKVMAAGVLVAGWVVVEIGGGNFLLESGNWKLETILLCTNWLISRWAPMSVIGRPI
jgi:hypothetical protein